MYEYTHQVDKVGYHAVFIKHHRYLVHRLVAQAFLNNYDELKDVHHIDKNKENNTVSNLRCIDSELHQKLHKTKYSKIKHCVVCGKEFEPPPTKRKRNKVCSDECRLLYLKSHNAQYKIPIEQLSLDGDMLNRNKEFINKIRELNSASITSVYENDVQRVGTVSENSLIGGRVIGLEGICFTLMACTHGYGMGNIYDNRKLK